MRNVEVHRRCALMVAVLTVPEVRESLASIRAAIESGQSPEPAMLALAHCIEHPRRETICRYDGIVTLSIAANDDAYWVCPSCRGVTVEDGRAY